ncbi:hypothetical protein [Algoriphagus marinus]|uniref:hypothetical protein n=1 Tax=Algoriphagus marinus TaxID=1925762 RepID=UPI00094BA66F|nr:hypothetical protein [Algoriphagus marinus]
MKSLHFSTRFIATCGLVVFVFLSANIVDGFSQQKFEWEFYGGPSKALLEYKVIPRNDFISPSNELSWHIGSSFLLGLKNNWQLSAQFEFFKRELGTYGVSRQIDTLQITGYSTEGIPLLALGIRKSIGDFYLQPSLSVMKSPSVLDQYQRADIWEGIPLGVRSLANVGLSLRFEGGIKKYNRRGNYFLAGLRYQQGLWVMDKMNAPVRYNERIEHVLSVKSRGSYLGAYVGYGVAGHNLNRTPKEKSKRIYSDSKLLKHNLSFEDGWYIMLYGGLRRREDPLFNEYFYSNTSGQYQFVFGYTKSRFSVESGFGNFSYNANYQINFDGINALIMKWEKYDMPIVPFTFKYHIPLNQQQSIRFGPSFSAYLALKNQSDSWFTSIGNGQVQLNDKTYTYTSEAYSDPELSHGRLVYNAGIFTEVSLFNSSFLTFKVSRNFASPDFVKIQANYLIEGSPIALESAGNMNGFLVDVGYKLPLKVINKKVKQNRLVGL